MYFGNIASDELKQFHHTIKNNFSMVLSDVFSQTNLFKIEEIVADNLYKIYPLFYCDTITSTNPNDEILDNKCIVCTKDNNTRLYFNNNDELINVDVGTVSLFIRRPSGQVYCYLSNSAFICFDRNSQRVLEGVKVTANLTDNNQKKFYDEAYSDKDGVAYLPELMKSDTYFVRGKITLEYNNQVITVWER